MRPAACDMFKSVWYKVSHKAHRTLCRIGFFAMSHEDELARMRSEMLALLAVNQTMRASRDLPLLYRAVAAQLGGVVRCDSLFIALYLPESDSVRFVHSV